MAYQYEEESQLTGTTVTEALRHLSIFFTSKSFEEIDETFNFRTDVNKDPEYVLEMITDALKNQFEINVDVDTVRQYPTIGELAEFVNSMS